MSGYAVKHKETGLFFGGFDANQEPLWVSKEIAKRFDDFHMARCQGIIFQANKIRAQIKPVYLA